MDKSNVTKVGSPNKKMQIIVSEPGKFMETLRQYAGSTVAVLPHGPDWTPVIEADDPLAEICKMRMPPFLLD